MVIFLLNKRSASCLPPKLNWWLLQVMVAEEASAIFLIIVCVTLTGASTWSFEGMYLFKMMKGTEIEIVKVQWFLYSCLFNLNNLVHVFLWILVLCVWLLNSYMCMCVCEHVWCVCVYTYILICMYVHMYGTFTLGREVLFWSSEVWLLLFYSNI